MKVKLLVSRCTDRGVQNVNDTVEVPEAEARRMIERGQAAPADKPAEGGKATK